MISTVKTLIVGLNEENTELKQEIKELKRKLQFRHTQINDLRYSKKQLDKELKNVKHSKNCECALCVTHIVEGGVIYPRFGGGI